MYEDDDVGFLLGDEQQSRGGAEESSGGTAVAYAQSSPPVVAVVPMYGDAQIATDPTPTPTPSLYTPPVVVAVPPTVVDGGTGDGSFLDGVDTRSTAPDTVSPPPPPVYTPVYVAPVTPTGDPFLFGDAQPAGVPPSQPIAPPPTFTPVDGGTGDGSFLDGITKVPAPVSTPTPYTPTVAATPPLAPALTIPTRATDTPVDVSGTLLGAPTSQSDGSFLSSGLPSDGTPATKITTADLPVSIAVDSWFPPPAATSNTGTMTPSVVSTVTPGGSLGPEGTPLSPTVLSAPAWFPPSTSPPSLTPLTLYTGITVSGDPNTPRPVSPLVYLAGLGLLAAALS